MAGLGNNIDTNFILWSKSDGYTQINNQQYLMWYFSDSMNSMGFQNDRYFPSKHLETIEGQPVTLQFYNFSPMLHTIHLHGMDVNQINDGVPQTSFAIIPGNWHTYEFIAPHAGTYHYHCHVDSVVHYHRGMSGAIIVRPPDSSTTQAWTNGPTFQEEVLWHLHTYDSTWKDISFANPVNARHRPDLFFLNGKQTPEAQIDPFTRVTLAAGETAYIRVLNSCYQWGRITLGGLPFSVVASDGRPMNQPPTVTEWEIGPGERYDLLLTSPTPLSAPATIQYLDDYTGAILGEAATTINII